MGTMAAEAPSMPHSCAIGRSSMSTIPSLAGSSGSPFLNFFTGLALLTRDAGEERRRFRGPGFAKVGHDLPRDGCIFESAFLRLAS